MSDNDSEEQDSKIKEEEKEEEKKEIDKLSSNVNILLSFNKSENN